MALNFFGYRNQWKNDKVCKFFESIDLLAEMDNFTNITSNEYKNLSLTMINVNEGVYVNKVNSAMHVNEMVFVSSATETVKLVKEFINYDASPILSEKLISENNEVAKVEKSMATTRNHYGNYGSMLNQLSKGSKPMANLLALAMVKAGANAQGVADGLKNFC